MTKRDQRAYEFFYENAGYSFDPTKETAEQGRQRCAMALVKAEKYAFNHDWECVWEDDWSVGDHQKYYGEAYKDGGPSTCESCVLYEHAGIAPKVLASLSCIDDATPQYRRLIEAELAFEAMS